MLMPTHGPILGTFEHERARARGDGDVKFLTSSVIQLLLFGALDALVLAQGPAPQWPAMTLFFVGELGVTAVICSLIVRQFGKAHMSEVLVTGVVGFIVSHCGVLAVLHLGPFSGNPSSAPGQSTFAWMELTLRVGLIVVMASTAGVLFGSGLRQFIDKRMRKHATAAQTGPAVAEPHRQAPPANPRATAGNSSIAPDRRGRLAARLFEACRAHAAYERTAARHYQEPAPRLHRGGASGISTNPVRASSDSRTSLG